MDSKSLYINCVNNLDSFHQDFDFNQTVIDLIKTIGGRKWSVNEKVWTIPCLGNSWIQKFKTTEKYAHITASAKGKIKNSLDNLELNNDPNTEKEEFACASLFGSVHELF